MFQPANEAKFQEITKNKEKNSVKKKICWDT